MSAPTRNDLDALPEAELLTLPEGAIPPGWLTEFFARRAAVIYKQNSNELALELSGESSRHLMIFRDMDPKEKRRRKEEEDRRRLLAEQELQEYRGRSDRLLARIEQQQIAVEKRRKEIEENALKLHDGRRVYIDGSQYRDEQGRILEGRDRDEAATLHNQKPNASKWQDRQKTIDEADELARLKQKVLDDRQQAERGGDVREANARLSGYEKDQTDLETRGTELARLKLHVLNDRQAAERGDVIDDNPRLSGYEKEFQNNHETRRAEIAATPAADLAASYSTDYMAAYGDEYTISIVPAFTKAADGQVKADPNETETDNPQKQTAPRAAGQIAPKI